MLISLAAAPSWAQEPTPPPAQPPAETKTPQPSGTTSGDKVLDAAKSKAAKSGKRVEIPERNTETTTLYANPDGKTVRLELSTQPVRVKNADGKDFTPIDTTLVEEAGVIKPKAIAGSLALSAGQDKTLLKSQAANATAKITVSSTLPKPTLKGNTATYADAYGKGRDLLVAATPTGFEQQIIIRERPTGSVSFRVPVELPSGLSFKKNTEGRPTIVGKDGKTLTEVRPTLIQDAKSADPNAPLDTGRASKAAVALADDGKTLVFTPDAAFLADPATAYPVTVTAARDDWYEEHTGWQKGGMDTWINDVDYKDSWDTQAQTQIVVGKSYASSVAKRWRGYLKFPNISPDFAGSKVQNADLHLWNYESNDCGTLPGSGITARQITSDWDDLTLHWDRQPSVTSTGADNEPGAYSETCSYAWNLTHSLDEIAQAWVDGATNYGIRLTAGNESDVRNWRRYTSHNAGGCMTAPLEDCKFQLHPPILTIDFELPVPPRRDTVVITSRDPLTSIPEYEEALTRSVYVPEPGESADALDPSDELIAASETHPYGSGDPINTDLISPDLPYPGDSEDTGNSGGEEDTAQPRVVATAPTNDDTDVAQDIQVRVTFSEEVLGSTFSVKSAEGVEVQGTTGSDDTGKIATFTPTQALRPGTKYTVTVSEAIDLSENTMIPHTWSFTTLRRAAGHWKFDEGNGGTAADSSGNDHDASLKDTAAWIAGKSGNAVSNMPSQARMAASRAAIQQGKAVEVADETSATSITYAQPDGKTFKTEVTAGPVRTRQSHGWVPIDTALAEQGGKLRPKALAEGTVMELSPGGTHPFVKMYTDGKSYALRWPTPLPKPTVKGRVATYTDAAGVGADLVVTALPTGFRHEVVLRQRPAKPVQLRIGVDDDGLTLTEGKGDRLLLKGKGDKPLATGTRPIVSDSSGKDRPGSAKRAEAGMDVVTKDGRTELVVKPDQAFLADAGTTYPVRVAAAMTLPLAADVDVSNYDTASSPAYPDNDYLFAGTMSDGSKYRTHLKFDTAGLQGGTVTGATLSMNTVDAHNCGSALARGIQVARLTSGWNPANLYWSGNPAYTTEDASTNFKGVNYDCEVYPDSMEWDVTGIAQDWAAGAADHGVVLKSPGEANVENYRLFTSSENLYEEGPPPTLTVTTSGPASAPTVSAPAITPAQTSGGTTVTSSLTPQLAATVADTAGGNLTGQFEVEHDPAATGQGTGQIWTGSSPAVASGGQATASVPAGKLADGWKVRWRARAVNAAAATASVWSNWQTATVDVPNPAVSAFQVTPAQVVGGVTVTTSVTPALHTTVIDPAAQPVRAEFEVEHDLAATGQGSGQIWAGAVDNIASGSQASLTVPEGKLSDGWKVRWRVRAVNPATTVGSPWSDWQALSVDVPDPVSEPAVGALQVTPSEQVSGTTVTPTRTPSLLAQVSDPAGKPLRAEFEIEHDPAATGQGTGQIWAGAADNVAAGSQASLAVPADTLSDGWQVRWRARAVSATVASAWSDWQSFTVSLPKPTATGLAVTPSKVVDGVTVTTRLTPTLQATLTHPAGQPLRAEAEIEHDPAAPEGQGTGQIWAGGVDNVASGTQAGLTVPDGKLTDGWKVRWRARAISADSASAWSDWQPITVDVTQPGEEPLAQTTGPVIRTDQSFTVSAWLRWSDKDGDYTVAEQKGTHQAPFRLGNTPDRGLVFTFTSADAADAAVEGVLSDVPPPVGEWFHLAGVYDAAAKTAALYLNGALVKSAPVSFATWNADASMSLGSKVKGDLDDVQIYQRPLSAEDVTVVVTSITAPASAGAPALQKEAAKALAAAVPGSFDYQRINLQTCQVSPGETGYAEYDARIRELSYNSCWSAYLYIQDYEEDDSDGKMKKSFCKSIFRLKIPAYICSRLNPLDEDLAFRFRATTIIHSYLGDRTGNGVVGGAGSGIKPSDMKVFVQLDDFAIVDEDGRVVVPAAQLKDLPISAAVDAHADSSLADGDCESEPDKRKDIKDWISSPSETFKVQATIDTSSAFICRIKPFAVFHDEILGIEYDWLTLPLWSQEVVGRDGKVLGVFRKGSGQPSGWKRWIPSFRCDSMAFGARNSEVEDSRGGCINTRAKRIFVMSYSRNPNFAEVIKHIEEAFTPGGFTPTYPPYRPAWVWDTPSLVPTKKILGNEQPKRITAGNWETAGPPLTKLDTDDYDLNRTRFSKIPMLMDQGTPEEMNWLIPADNTRHKIYINYCKYYEPKKYNEPFRPDRLPIGGPNSCDEYPFASTKEGAGTAQGKYSLRALNRSHNSSHGGTIRNWYKDYRVGTGNSFWVLIEP
ncbi:DNRLRE domain-containing protein [Nonomuraea jiangxiensis]|nr:DNRLRE domain-containing protein [Nonomuraea jiangxiensis]